MRRTSGQWRRVADGPLARPNGISEESGTEASLEALRPTTSLRALRGHFVAASMHVPAFAGGLRCTRRAEDFGSIGGTS